MPHINENDSDTDKFSALKLSINKELDSILNTHLQDIKAGHAGKLRDQLITWRHIQLQNLKPQILAKQIQVTHEDWDREKIAGYNLGLAAAVIIIEG